MAYSWHTVFLDLEYFEQAINYIKSHHDVFIFVMGYSVQYNVFEHLQKETIVYPVKIGFIKPCYDIVKFVLDFKDIMDDLKTR